MEIQQKDAGIRKLARTQGKNEIDHIDDPQVSAFLNQFHSRFENLLVRGRSESHQYNYMVGLAEGIASSEKTQPNIRKSMESEIAAMDELLNESFLQHQQDAQNVSDTVPAAGILTQKSQSESNSKKPQASTKISSIEDKIFEDLVWLDLDVDCLQKPDIGIQYRRRKEKGFDESLFEMDQRISALPESRKQFGLSRFLERLKYIVKRSKDIKEENPVVTTQDTTPVVEQKPIQPISPADNVLLGDDSAENVSSEDRLTRRLSVLQKYATITLLKTTITKDKKIEVEQKILSQLSEIRPLLIALKVSPMKTRLIIQAIHIQNMVNKSTSDRENGNDIVVPEAPAIEKDEQNVVVKNEQNQPVQEAAPTAPAGSGANPIKPAKVKAKTFNVWNPTPKLIKPDQHIKNITRDNPTDGSFYGKYLSIFNRRRGVDAKSSPAASAHSPTPAIKAAAPHTPKEKPVDSAHKDGGKEKPAEKHKEEKGKDAHAKDKH